MLFSRFLEKLQMTPVHQTVTSAIITIAFLIFSGFIPLLSNEENRKIYIPTPLDYFRVMLISLMTSLSLNFAFTLISKLSLLLKILVQFLAVTLLALPQKSEIERGHKGWNLTKREVFLFGMGMQIGNLVFYVWDLWHYDAINELANGIATNRFEKAILNADQNTPENRYELFHQYVSRKSTLANCIEVRKKTKSLKKNIYSNVYSAAPNTRSHSDQESHLETDNLLLSLTSSTSPSALSYGLHLNSNSPSGSPPPPIIRLRELTTTESTYVNCTLPGDKSMLYAWCISFFGDVFRNGEQWYLPTLMILLTTMWECGLALILAVCFIYVPGFNDTLFTEWEIFFYDRVWLFFGIVVIPVWVLSLLVYGYLLHLTLCSNNNGLNNLEEVGNLDGSYSNNNHLIIKLGIASIVCCAVFVFGLRYT